VNKLIYYLHGTQWHSVNSLNSLSYPKSCFPDTNGPILRRNQIKDRLSLFSRASNNGRFFVMTISIMSVGRSYYLSVARSTYNLQAQFSRNVANFKPWSVY